MALPDISSKKIQSLLAASSPIVSGVSWEPPYFEVEKARGLLAFLGDRRVLTGMHIAETVKDTLVSVQRIRHNLERESGKTNPSSPLAKSLLAMRMVCLRFLDDTDGIRPSRDFKKDRRSLDQRYVPDAKLFYQSLGRFRTMFGIYIAQLSVQYGVDVPGKLARILPDPLEDPSTGHPFSPK